MYWNFVIFLEYEFHKVVFILILLETENVHDKILIVKLTFFLYCAHVGIRITIKLVYEILSLYGSLFNLGRIVFYYY